MRSLKWKQLSTIFLLSVLILVIHFFIISIGNFPGGEYGMAPILLIFGLPILGLVWIGVIFILNSFNINLSSLQTALFYTLSYLFIALSKTVSMANSGDFKLFILPAIISFLLFWASSFLIKSK